MPISRSSASVARGVALLGRKREGLRTCAKCQLQIRSEREDTRACPVCKTAMEKAVVLNIVIDKCPSCHGAWLDGGELGLLKQAIEAGASSDLTTGLCLGMAIR